MLRFEGRGWGNPGGILALAMAHPRVLAALSGGVDSAVAALLLIQEGYDVVGVFLRNGVSAPENAPRPGQGCCSAEDARDAALLANQLGIPFHAVDMEAEFVHIQRAFRQDYAAGHTPNPCAVCNRDIKFGSLARFADSIGAEWLATGHYARILQSDGRAELHRGRDRHKDQSYVLFPVPESTLRRTLLPLGELQKSKTRELAAAAGIRVATKPDSQEICFVPEGDYRQYLLRHGGLGQAGRFLHVDGQELGEHSGHMGFTRGQRRGLGIAWHEPLFVVDIRPVEGDVLLGPRSALGCPSAQVQDFQGLGEDFFPGDVLLDVAVQYRSAPGCVAAKVEILANDRAEISFLEHAESVNPGQGLAVYRGDRLIAGGWIERIQSPAVGSSV